jgi:pentatricopeptide repeat protein
LLRLADRAKISGNLEQAVEYLELGAELDPENPLYIHELADVFEKLGLASEASTARRTAEKLEDAFIVYRDALIHLKKETYQEGIELLEPVVRENPRFDTGLSLLAILYRKAGHYDKALDVYSSMLEQDPSLESALQSSIWIKLENDDLEGALSLLEKTMQESVDSHLVRGYQRLLEEDWEGALAEFYAAQSHYPLHPRILHQISHCLEELGRPAEALSALEQAYFAYPDDPEIHHESRRIRYRYGLELEKKHKWENALIVFQRLSKEDPEDSHYLFHIGYSNQNLGRYQQALDSYFDGLNPETDSDWVRKNIAFCFTALNQYQEASDHWEIVAERSPEPVNIYHYGLSLIRQWKLKKGWVLVRKSARDGFAPAKRLLSKAGMDY